jgi:hypothetical protein
MNGTDYHDDYTGSQYSSSGFSRDVQFRATATGIWDQIKSGTQQTYRIYDLGADKYLQLTHNGTNALITASSGAVAMESPVKLKAYTVATLPSTAAAGMTTGATAYVTDATAPTYLGTLTGGGAVVCPVFYNGSAWVSH